MNSQPGALQARFQSFARGAAILIVLAMLTLVVRRYMAYRVDHVTQVPMLLIRLDPTLFPGDWFLHSQGQYPMRKVFLAIEMLLHRLLPSVPLILFTQYMVSRPEID